MILTQESSKEVTNSMWEFKRAAYVEAESNIFRLLNFDMIDGLILDAVNLVVGQGKEAINKVAQNPNLTEEEALCGANYDSSFTSHNR